jgi:DNA-binding transcriptional regulator YhcF (GntR family)
MSLSETEVVIANQKTILENQALILKGQAEIKKNQATLSVIVRNQEEILAAQRHCMYREALEEHLKSCESRGTTKEELATRN